MKKLISFTFAFAFTQVLFAQLSSTALYFDGGDVVTDENFWQVHPSLGGGNFTIEAWIRDEAPADNINNFMQTIIVTGDIGLNDGFLMYIGNGQLQGQAGGGYLEAGGPELRDSTCHHVAMVRNGYYLTGYVDGVPVSFGNGADSATSASPIQIGNVLPFGSDGFKGLIKEVRLWNTARTQAEIQNNMNVVLPNQNALIGYWRCNEGAGTSVNNYSGNTTAHFGNLTYGGGSPDWACGCPSACPVPYNLSTTYIAQHTVTLNWHTNPCATGYKVRYKKAGTSWTNVSVSGNTGTVIIGFLTENTHYVWEVRSKCSTNPAVLSAWSAPVKFHTAPRMAELPEEETTLDIFPNPASGTLNIQTGATVRGLLIQNSVGQILIEKNFAEEQGSNMQVDVSTLAAGVYMVTILRENGRDSKLVVKQ